MRMVRLCNAQSNNMIDLKFITTFNNISTISQQLVLMVDYVGDLGKVTHKPYHPFCIEQSCMLSQTVSVNAKGDSVYITRRWHDRNIVDPDCQEKRQIITNNFIVHLTPINDKRDAQANSKTHFNRTIRCNILRKSVTFCALLYFVLF